MASRSLGTLTLDLVANIGGYTTGLGKAEREAQKRAQAIERAFDGAFKTIGAGIAAAAAAGTAALAIVNQQADAIANYQDLADKIGDTAEAIASLQNAAVASGTALDVVAAASVKLTAALSKTDDEGKLVGQALAAIGLEFDNFKDLAPVDQIDAVAKALAGFEDGAQKTAVAVALFGKSGADLIPFLNDLADGSERQITLTAEQIKQADEYSKAQAKLRGEFDLFVKQQSAELLPTLQEINKVLVELAKNETTVSTATELVKGAVDAAVVVFQTLAVVGSDVGFVFLSVGREIAAWAAQLVALGSGDLAGFRAISDAVKADGERARAELDKFQARILAIGTGTRSGGDLFGLGPTAPARPTINTGGLSTDTEKTNKALKDQKKELDLVAEAWSFVARSEEDALKAQQDILLANHALAESYLNALDPTRQLATELQKISDLVDQGFLTPQEGIDAEILKLKEAYKGVADEVSTLDEFSQNAARNIQESLGNNLVDVLQGDFKSIGDSFGKLLIRMAAEALAADITKGLFGKAGGGEGGGLLGGLFESALSGLSGLFGARATGGSVTSNGAYLVGERGPELFVPSTAGYVMNTGQTEDYARGMSRNLSSGGSVTQTVNIQIDGTTDMARNQELIRKAVIQGNIEFAEKQQRENISR